MCQVKLKFQSSQTMSDHGVKCVIESPGTEASVVRPRRIIFQHQWMNTRISTLSLHVTCQLNLLTRKQSNEYKPLSAATHYFTVSNGRTGWLQIQSITHFEDTFQQNSTRLFPRTSDSCLMLDYVHIVNLCIIIIIIIIIIYTKQCMNYF